MEVDRTFNYCDDVLSGKILANKYVIQACKNFLTDTRRNNKDNKYYFSRDAAEEVITVCQSFRAFDGPLAGEKIRLLDWQVFFIANVYGFLKVSDDERRYRRALLYVARYNMKTTFAALLSLYTLLTTPNGEVVSVATSTEQAEYILNYMKRFCEAMDDDPDFKDEYGNPLLEVYDSHIYCPVRGSFYRAKSSIVRKQQGFHPTLLCADEIASYPETYRIIDVIESGMKRPSPRPLTLFTTTADQDVHTIGYQEVEKAKKILTGKIPDDTYFALLYCIDEKDKWDDISVVEKANPSLGVSVSLEEIKQSLKDAAIHNDPIQILEYKTKTANIYVAGTKGGFSEKVISAPKTLFKKRSFKEYVTDEYLRNCPCAGGIDLSKRFDFTAYTLYWYIKDIDKYYARHRFYIPEDQIAVKMKRDSTAIQTWIDEGYIQATPGKTVDYTYLRNDLIRDITTYNIAEIGYDLKYSSSLVDELMARFPDIPTVLKPISNSHQKQHDNLSAWQAALVDEKLIDGNPVWAWMMTNASITSRYGLSFVEKIGDTEAEKTTKRIDGVDTSIMAYNCLVPRINGGNIVNLSDQLDDALDFLIGMNDATN